VRRPVALAVLVTAAIVATAAPAPARTVSPEEWGRSFCGVFLDWGEDMSERRAEREEDDEAARDDDDLRAARAVMVDSMRDFRRITKRARTRLTRAGEPDVDNGAEIVEVIIGAFKELEGLLADASDAARDLPVGDADEFDDGAAAISEDLDRGNEVIDDSFSRIGELDGDGELDAVLSSLDECEPLGES